MVGSCQERIMMVGSCQECIMMVGFCQECIMMVGSCQERIMMVGSCQGCIMMVGSCQEPVRTVRMIRKIKILPGPPGGLQEASRRPLGSWHPNKILMYKYNVFLS